MLLWFLYFFDSIFRLLNCRRLPSLSRTSVSVHSTLARTYELFALRHFLKRLERVSGRSFTENVQFFHVWILQAAQNICEIQESRWAISITGLEKTQIVFYNSMGILFLVKSIDLLELLSREAALSVPWFSRCLEKIVKVIATAIFFGKVDWIFIVNGIVQYFYSAVW